MLHLILPIYIETVILVMRHPLEAKTLITSQIIVTITDQRVKVKRSEYDDVPNN